MPPILTEPWWSWNPETAGTLDHVYRGFNLFEAGAWFVFAALVLARWRRNRHSFREVAYAAAFVAFGLTDVAEAYRQSPGLVAIKGVILTALLVLRAQVIRRWYPTSRVY
jgi:hypothetical protein